MTSQVVVLGDANVDMVIRLPDRASGQVDLTGSEPRLYGGGSAANVAAGNPLFVLKSQAAGTSRKCRPPAPKKTDPDVPIVRRSWHVRCCHQQLN